MAIEGTGRMELRLPMFLRSAGRAELLDQIDDRILRATSEAFEHATRGQRAIYALRRLEDEVCCGGFEQFFHNDGDLTDDVVTAARLIGAQDLASIVEAARQLVGDGAVLRDHAQRKAFVDALTETQRRALDDLDERFFRIIRRDSGAHLQQKQVDYVNAHVDEFFYEARGAGE